MKIDDNFKTRITLARQSMGLTQGELAEKIGVVRRQVAAYEAGDSKPRERVLNNLAAALGATVEWLSSGVGESPDLKDIRKTITIPEIPVYSYDQAYGLFSGKPGITGTMAPLFYIPAPDNSTEKSFALSISGSSMESPCGISFLDRGIVTFDPMGKPTDKDFVLAYMHKAKDVTFKQLIRRNSKWYLHPLNPTFADVPLDKSMSIAGLAIHYQYDLGKYRLFNAHSDSGNLMTKLGVQHEEMLGFVTKEDTSTNSRLDKIESMLEQLLKNK